MDNKGHFLLVSGILIILGFVIFATAVSHSALLEEGTEREQKGDIVYGTDELVQVIERAVRNYAVGGELDKERFARLAHAVELAAHEHAARAGLFVEISLAPVSPALQAYPDRCIGFDPHPGSALEGIVVGWERDTLAYGIVGVIYDLYVSDGSRSLRFEHYVEIRPCAENPIRTHIKDWNGAPGFVRDVLNSHWCRAALCDPTGKDGDVATEILEEKSRLPSIVKLSPKIRDDTGGINWERGWQGSVRKLEVDGDYAFKQSSRGTTPNYLRFLLDPPSEMRQGDRLEDVTVWVVVQDNQPPAIQEDLYLRVYHPFSGDPNNPGPLFGEVQVPLPTQPNWGLLDLGFSEGPSGPGWSYDEIKDAMWEFTVIKEEQAHNQGRQIRVDRYFMQGDIIVFPWMMDLYLEWPAIPPIYNSHALDLQYRVTPGTPGEQFHLYVRDLDSDSPWQELHVLSDTSACTQGVCRFQYTGDLLSNRPQFWLRDDTVYRTIYNLPDDPNEALSYYDFLVPEDRDNLEIFLMRIVSSIG